MLLSPYREMIGRRYSVVMMDTQTGERRTVDIGLDWTEGSDYWWNEGNFSCDCNRESEFYRGHDREVQCGDGRFQIVAIKFHDPQRAIP